MTFARIKPFGWSLNEKLTSAQISLLDEDHAKAVDKTGDTITGTITIAAAAILAVASGGAISVASGGDLTISGTAQIASGGQLIAASGGTVTIASGASIHMAGSSFVTGIMDVSGAGSAISVTSSGLVAVGSGGLITFASGAGLTAFAGSTVTLSGTITVSATAVLTAASGGVWTLNNAVTASNITISGTARLKVASRTITRVVADSGVPSFNTGTNLPHFNAVSGRWAQIELANLPTLRYELDLPHNSVLESVMVRFKPATGHAASPAFLPEIEVFKRDLVASSPVSLGTAGDTFGSAAAYEIARSLTVSGLNETIDRSNYRYYVTFDGEWSTNAVAGLVVFGCSVSETITEYDEGSA